MLNWNLTKIKNRDTVCFTSHEDGKCLKNLTDRLIWATIPVELGEIKASNIDEWLFRFQGLAIAYSDPSWGEITRAELEAHIGLSTNVLNTTRAQFVRKIARVVERAATNAVRHAESQAAREAAAA